MKIIHRYIIWELLIIFLASFIAMTTLLIIGVLVEKAIAKNVPIIHIVRMVPYVVVETSRISLPMTLLLAVTTFFAKMSGNNEVIALKSLGIPPHAFLLPVMAFGIFVSLFAVWLNEMAVTWGRTGINTVLYLAAEDILLEQLKRNHTFETDSQDIVIMVKGVENRRLIAPTITLKNPPSTIEAQSAELKINFAAQTLTVLLSNVKVEGAGAKYTGHDRIISIALPQVVQDINAEPSVSNMGFKQLEEETDMVLEKLDKQRRIIAAQKVFAGGMGAIDAWSAPKITQLNNENQNSIKRLKRLAAEYPRRWATSFSCFFFIWVGAPLAIWMKKADIFSSFFACFIPVLLFYYPLLMYGMTGAKNGTLPANAVWVANICLGIIGLWFMRRIHRY
ncbi:MAG: LptF/LptG family permease [Planctomycetaceae bacterium]|jgi:lipopolysaccharide export system permease protein|nr:LptF/LptG family permease [Planctomycetaceae bacterium]